MENLPETTESSRSGLIFEEETTCSKYHETQRTSIAAAKVIAESLKSSLGPMGRDKALVDEHGFVTITNDGATILDNMEIDHPAAKILIEAAKTQDREMGDGTKTVVVLAGRLLEKAEDLIKKGVHPTTIIDGYSLSAKKALQLLEDMAMPVKADDRKILKKIAATAMASKLLTGKKEFFANIIVDAVLHVTQMVGGKREADPENIKMQKKLGGTLLETKLIRGIILEKEAVHTEMPKEIKKAKIAILNCPLEVETIEFDTKIHFDKMDELKDWLDEEKAMLKKMVKKVASVGANVVISQEGIDELAQYYLSKKGILAVQRITSSDLSKVVKATNGRIVTDIMDLRPNDLGAAEIVKEEKIGSDKLIFIEGCKNPLAVTVLIRGGAERILEEAERSLHDAIFVVKDVIENPRVLVGGGAPEIEVARRLRNYSTRFRGKEQLAIANFAEALEILPMTLAENAGGDPIDAIVQCRSRHGKDEHWVGIDGESGEAKDMRSCAIYEPLAVKMQAIKSASETASMILKIDNVIAESE